jgi:hypothetical protein
MVSFSLEPPDTGDLRTPPANTQGAADSAMATSAPARTMEGVLPPPRLPYASDPATYTHLWISQTSTMTREEIKEEVLSYLEAWSGSGTPDYAAIQNQVVASKDWYGFLTILPKHQVCLIHALGPHSSGLGKQTPAHNRFFGLLGDKIGDQLPPVVMAPSLGLTPWLKIKDVHRLAPGDLQELENEIKTVLQPSLDDNVVDDERPKVLV